MTDKTLTTKSFAFKISKKLGEEMTQPQTTINKFELPVMRMELFVRQVANLETTADSFLNSIIKDAREVEKLMDEAIKLTTVTTKMPNMKHEPKYSSLIGATTIALAYIKQANEAKPFSKTGTIAVIENALNEVLYE